tara:strand:+ start:59 stop:280 length:222 start_codon:yes stop_codon:yes gene_type:complete
LYLPAARDEVGRAGVVDVVVDEPVRVRVRVRARVVDVVVDEPVVVRAAESARLWAGPRAPRRSLLLSPGGAAA